MYKLLSVCVLMKLIVFERLLKILCCFYDNNSVVKLD